MRFSIVARSLGVILASPLLALPLGFAGESESTAPLHAGTAQLTEQLVPAGSAPVAVEGPAPRVLLAAVRPPTKNVTVAAAQPAAPEEVVTVSCATDGCVVSSGLDVVVVASPPRR